MSSEVSRRDFLRLSAVTITGALLAACDGGEKETPNFEATVEEAVKKTNIAEDVKINPPEKTFEPLKSPSPTKESTPPFVTITTFPSPTEVETTPTPTLHEIDVENQKKLENTRMGVDLNLPKPGLTSFWRFPWFSEGNEPKEAVIALVWGEKHPSGIITSAAKIYDRYNQNDDLGDTPVNVFLTVTKSTEDAKRINLLETEVSNYPPAGARIVDARYMNVVDKDGQNQRIPVEEVKELDRLQQFLSKLNWKEIASSGGEVTGEVIARFASGFIEAWKEYGPGINLPKLPNFPSLPTITLP